MPRTEESQSHHDLFQIIDDIRSTFCQDCGCFNMLHEHVRKRALMKPVWPIRDKEMVSIQLSVHGEEAYIQYKMDQYHLVARVLDTKRRSNKRFQMRERARTKRRQKNATLINVDQPISNVKIPGPAIQQKPTVKPITKPIIPLAVIQNIRAQAKLKVKAFAKPSAEAVSATAGLKAVPMIPTVGNPAVLTSTASKPTADLSASTSTVERKKRKRKGRGSGGKTKNVDSMDVEGQAVGGAAVNMDVDVVVEDWDKDEGKDEVEVVDPTDAVEVQGNQKKKRRKKGKKGKDASVANINNAEADGMEVEGAVGQNDEVVAVFESKSVGPAARAKKPSKRRRKKKLIVPPTPLQQVQPMATTPTIVILNAGPTVVTPTAQPIAVPPTIPQPLQQAVTVASPKKRTLMQSEFSDDEEVPIQLQSKSTTTTKPNPIREKQTWRTKRKILKLVYRLPQQQQPETPRKGITQVLHTYTIETLEVLLWSLREQLTRIASMEYVGGWRHGKFYLNDWDTKAGVVEDVYHDVKMLEMGYGTGNCEEDRSGVGKNILALVKQALEDCTPHLKVFQSVYNRLVPTASLTKACSMTQDLARLIETESSWFLENHVTNRRLNSLEKSAVVRTEIKKLWDIISGWTMEEGADGYKGGDGYGRISDYIRKREQLNMVAVLMNGYPANEYVDQVEMQEFQEHLAVNAREEQERGI
ncbi:UNVERIFIED_CONTAM: hypothetical protein HDU68_004400, partial [Siphonaria sp. JEL0065]